MYKNIKHYRILTQGNKVQLHLAHQASPLHHRHSYNFFIPAVPAPCDSKSPVTSRFSTSPSATRNGAVSSLTLHSRPFLSRLVYFRIVNKPSCAMPSAAAMRALSVQDLPSRNSVMMSARIATRFLDGNTATVRKSERYRDNVDEREAWEPNDADISQTTRGSLSKEQL